MEILKNQKDLNEYLNQIRGKRDISLIPTMGSIHEGHLSLIQSSLKKGFFSISSIYVNPSQFNSNSDFLNYPRSIEEDINKISDTQCDLLYVPFEKDIYPNGVNKIKKVEKYRNILCDKYRPGHFDGVTTVVESLFNIINPDHVFFGEKDFQQLKIISELIKILKLKISIHPCPSIRMLNGISISSRFKKFTNQDAKIFNDVAYQIQMFLKNIKGKEDLKKLKNLKKNIYDFGANNIEYLEIREEENLLISDDIKKSRLFIGLYIGKIRLIDNFLLY